MLNLSWHVNNQSIHKLPRYSRAHPKLSKVLDLGVSLHSHCVPRTSLGQIQIDLSCSSQKRYIGGKICVTAVKRGFCGAVKRDRASPAEKVRICESLKWPKPVVLFSHSQ